MQFALVCCEKASGSVTDITLIFFGLMFQTLRTSIFFSNAYYAFIMTSLVFAYYIYACALHPTLEKECNSERKEAAVWL